MNSTIIAMISEKYKSVRKYLDERSCRVWAAAEAKAIGRGGINTVRTATGMGYSTLKKGFEELENPPTDPKRIRKPGGGKKEENRP
jgi:hypothetical protein